MAFFKLEKPKQFTFIPRFYDAQKEELEERIEAIRREVDPPSDSEYRPNIRGQMRKRHDALYGARVKPKKSLISKWLTTIIYVGLALLVVYFIIQILSLLD